MSTISLTGSSGSASLSDSSTLSSYKKIQLDLQALDKALESGDVTSAKTAFVTLQKDAPNLAAQSQNRQSTNPRAQAMALLGRALQQGDVNLAQRSLGALKEVMTGANQGDASSTSDTPLTLADYLNAPDTGASPTSTQGDSLLDYLNTASTDNASTQSSGLLDYTANGTVNDSNNGTLPPGSLLNSIA